MKVKHRILDSAEKVAGRRALWRLGRNLYQQARFETNNRISTNGEATLQRNLAIWSAQSDGQLVAFDVGANIGEWTLSLLKVAREVSCSNLEIHSFEPVPATFDLLTTAVSRDSDSGRVVVVPHALSHQTGESEIFVSRAGAGTNSLVQEAVERRHGTEALTITTQTAVDYCATADIERIDLLKIDVEGFDMSVIEGARPLLEEERVGVCQFEYNHTWVFSRRYLKDAFDIAASLENYRVGRVTPDQVWLFDEWHPELERFFEANYVLVHRDFEKACGAVSGYFDRSNTYRLETE